MRVKTVDIPPGIVVQVLLAGLFLLVPAGHSGDTITVIQPPGAEMKLTVDSPNSLFIADQHQENQSQIERKDPPEKATEDKSPKGQSQSGSVGQKPNKALKPFRPSERIKADQAVDFPSDI